MSDLPNKPDFPTLAELENELSRVKRKKRTRSFFAGFIAAIVAVVATCALVATYVTPVLEIHGDSMDPTLDGGDVVVALSLVDVEPGDIVAFHQDDKVLVKRVVAVAGDRVDVNDAGVVSVNGVVIDEPYVDELSLGNCDVSLPCEVGEASYFVMGDNRISSVDSRSSLVGCVGQDQVIGVVKLRVWPLESAGAL